MFRLRATAAASSTALLRRRCLSTRPSASLPPSSSPPGSGGSGSAPGAYPQELAKAVLRIGLIYTTFVAALEINPSIGSYIKEKAPNIYNFTRPSRELFNSMTGGVFSPKQEVVAKESTQEAASSAPKKSDSSVNNNNINNSDNNSKIDSISKSSSNQSSSSSNSPASESVAASKQSQSDAASPPPTKTKDVESASIRYDYVYSAPTDALQYPAVAIEQKQQQPAKKEQSASSSQNNNNASSASPSSGASTSTSSTTTTNNSQTESSVASTSKPILPITSAETKLDSVKSQSATGVLAKHGSETSSLMKELEASLIVDLPTLDERALRTRIFKLAEVCFERTQWEGIRMSQALQQVESELSRKYMDLMINQRAELELEVNKIASLDKQTSMDQLLASTEKAIIMYEQKLQATLRDASNEFQKSRNERLAANEKEVTENLYDETNYQVQTMRQAHVEELINFHNILEITKSQLGLIEKDIQGSINSSSTAKHSHDESAALFILETVLSTEEPLGPYVSGLRGATKGDELITTLIDAIPKEALENGVLSETALRAKFSVARNEVRKVLLTPEEVPSVIGHAIGSALATLSLAPKGLVDVRDTNPNPNSRRRESADDRMSRAAFLLDNGQLGPALLEIEKIEGYERTQLSDWEGEARRRLQLNQAVKIVRTASSLRHKVHS